MDEKLLRKINRQLRAIKVVLSLFFILIITMIALLGFIAYKIVIFTDNVNTKIDNIETKTSQSFNLKSQLCSTNNYLSSQVCK